MLDAGADQAVLDAGGEIVKVDGSIKKSDITEHCFAPVPGIQTPLP